MSTPSGWYPDPSDPGQQRWWDGNRWSDHRQPNTAALPAYAAPVGAAPTDGRATTSLVLGVLSLVLCGLFTGIPAIVMGRAAARDIDASGGRVGGRGLATAGFVTGLIGTLWSGLGILLVIGVFIFGASVDDSFSDSCSSTVGTGSDC